MPKDKDGKVIDYETWRMYVANCCCCLLADAMKQCKICNFNIGLGMREQILSNLRHH